MNELKEIQGIIEAKNKKNNSVKIKDFGWIGNRFKPEITFSLGDEVLIKYYEKGEFRNHESIELIKKSEKKEEDLPTSMLLSYSKDLAVALIQSGSINSDDLKEVMRECNEAIIFGKKDIQKRINDKETI